MQKMFWLFIAILILGLAVFAQVPQTISFQGRLSDISGEPLPDSDYELTFRLYDSESGGTALWSELQTVNTSNGLFTVMLGAETPFVDIEDFYAPLWLSVDIRRHRRTRTALSTRLQPLCIRRNRCRQRKLCHVFDVRNRSPTRRFRLFCRICNQCRLGGNC